MTDDTDLARYRALELEMSEPMPGVSHIYGNADVLEPEPVAEEPEWKRAYANTDVYSHMTDDEITAAGNDALFSPHTGEDGVHVYIVTRRGEEEWPADQVAAALAWSREQDKRASEQ